MFYFIKVTSLKDIFLKTFFVSAVAVVVAVVVAFAVAGKSQKQQRMRDGVRVAIWPFLKLFPRNKMVWPFGHFLAFFEC